MQGLLSVMAMGDTIQDTKILPIHVLNSVLKQGPCKVEVVESRKSTVPRDWWPTANPEIF